MTSDTDLPHQADTLQQPPLMKKKSNPIWKVIFLTLLTINLVSLIYWVSAIASGGSFGGYVLLISWPYLLVISLIDLIAIASYINKHNQHSSHGIAKKIIIDTALIAAGFMLICAGVIAYMATNLI